MMMDLVFNGLVVAGVLAMLTVPGMAWVMIGYASTMRRLEERNAAQAQTIAGLTKRLGRASPEVPPPPRGEWPAMRGVDEAR